MRRPNLRMLIIAALVLAPATFADTIVSSGSWRLWGPAVPPTNGTPFWNNAPTDGGKTNIGYCLAGGGNCTISGAPGAIPYLGTGSGGYVDFTFTRGTPASSNAALKIEIAGNASSNKFGWYDTSDGSLHELFNGPAGAGATAFHYTPSASYGFYLDGPGGLFKSGAEGRNFALFQQSATEYWLGMEDLKLPGYGGNSDKDYNDMVVKITTNVPDGGVTFMLLGGVLVGLESLRRKFSV